MSAFRRPRKLAAPALGSRAPLPAQNRRRHSCRRRLPRCHPRCRRQRCRCCRWVVPRRRRQHRPPAALRAPLRRSAPPAAVPRASSVGRADCRYRWLLCPLAAAVATGHNASDGERFKSCHRRLAQNRRPLLAASLHSGGFRRCIARLLCCCVCWSFVITAHTQAQQEGSWQRHLAARPWPPPQQCAPPLLLPLLTRIELLQSDRKSHHGVRSPGGGAPCWLLPPPPQCAPPLPLPPHPPCPAPAAPPPAVKIHISYCKQGWTSGVFPASSRVLRHSRLHLQGQKHTRHCPGCALPSSWRPSCE